jgi:hypothetical protein
MLIIQSIPWFRETLSNFRVDDINANTFPIEGGHAQCRIGFSIVARSGNQQGQVVPILETGSAQPHYISAQKYVVLKCLRALQNIGYNIPTYSSMGIQALNLGRHHDIGGYCAQLAENNINDVVSLVTYI